MARHISGQYEAELDAARRLLMEMAGLVERQLADAGEALFRHDALLTEKVFEVEDQINRLEMELDDACIQMIARRQPAATDLRTLIAFMKSSTDLERIGDEAERLARLALKVVNLEVPADQYADLRRLHKAVVDMLFQGLGALARTDAEGAEAVIALDEGVDDIYRHILESRAISLEQGNDRTDVVLNTMWAARSLERIGDHAKNISEYVVYAVRGEDVRHPESDNGESALEPA